MNPLSPLSPANQTRRHARPDAGAALVVLAALAAVAMASPAAAQSGSGLKLGEEPPPPTLDLGAGPADAPAAEPPGSTTGPADAPAAEPAGETPTRRPTVAGGQAAGGPIEDAVRTTHGDWEVACAPGNDKGGCAMAQIGNDVTGTPVLEMVIRKLVEPLEVEEQTAVAVLDVITPLGVVLTEGLTMKIDSGNDEAAAFQICTEQGCLVREPVGEDLIARLRRGRTAKLTVFAAQQGEVTSDISLKGFTAAWNATR